jgi:hypothetical protein
MPATAQHDQARRQVGPHLTFTVHVAAPVATDASTRAISRSRHYQVVLAAPDPRNAAAPWPDPRCPQTARPCAWRHAIASRVGKATPQQSDRLEHNTWPLGELLLHTARANQGLLNWAAIVVCQRPLTRF